LGQVLDNVRVYKHIENYKDPVSDIADLIMAGKESMCQEKETIQDIYPNIRPNQEDWLLKLVVN